MRTQGKVVARTRLVAAAVAAGGGALLACGEAATRSAEAPTIRDSAGVRLVAYGTALPSDSSDLRVPAESPRWRLAGVPGREAPELYRLLSAAFLPDGRVIVAHASGRELLLVDTSGSVVRIIGRPGSGPGEFRAIASVFATPRAEILAFDQVQRRVTRFDTLGSIIDQRSVATPTQPDGTFSPAAIEGARGEGDPLVRIFRREERTDPVGAIRVRTAWLGRDGSWRATGRDAFADDSVYRVPGSDGSVAMTMVPFAEQPLSLVCGDRIVRAHSHASGLSFESLDGALRVRVSIPVASSSASDDDLRSALGAGLPPGESVPDEIVAGTRARRADIRVPALRRLLCDPDGEVWLVRFPRAGATRQLLTAVTGDGLMGATVSVPLPWRLLAVARDRVLVATVQDDGTESLEEWPVATRR